MTAMPSTPSCAPARRGPGRPRKNPLPIQSPAVASGDPVGKVRWALEMLSRGSADLVADLLKERAKVMAMVDEIDRQIAILKMINPAVEQPEMVEVPAVLRCRYESD